MEIYLVFEGCEDEFEGWESFDVAFVNYENALNYVFGKLRDTYTKYGREGDETFFSHFNGKPTNDYYKIELVKSED